MYTGIVDHFGTIKSINIDPTNNSAQMWIQTEFTDFAHGESISINGVCITVAESNEGTNKSIENLFRCDLSPETLKLTSLGQYQEGDIVNLERSLRANDRLGGHFVLGHVDQVAHVKSIIEHGDYTEIEFTGITSEGQAYIVKKGCVCLNGVSLTINEVSGDEFSVMLIPTTLQKTNLHRLIIGDRVNIEYDWMARIVVKHLERHNEALRAAVTPHPNPPPQGGRGQEGVSPPETTEVN